MNKKPILWTILLLLSIIVVSGETTYTPTSITTCENGTCNKVLWGGTKYVYEDNQWKDKKDAKSWKNTEIKCRITKSNIDIDVDINCEEYNLTYWNMTVTAPKTGKYPIKVWKLNETTGNESLIYENEFNFATLNDKKFAKLNNLKNIHLYRVEIGENSTTVILKDVDTEILDDAGVLYAESLGEGNNETWDPDWMTFKLSNYTGGFGYSGGWDTHEENLVGTEFVTWIDSSAWFDSLGQVSAMTMIDITDCQSATEITVVIYNTSTVELLSEPDTLLYESDPFECVEGYTLTPIDNLTYVNLQRDSRLIGIKGDSEFNLSLDKTGESKDNYQYNGSWVYHQDTAYRFNWRMLSQTHWGFIKFNVSSIPAGSVISKAELGTQTNDHADAIQVFEASNNWTEETLTYQNRPTIGDYVGNFTSSSWSNGYAIFDLGNNVDLGDNYTLAFYMRDNQETEMYGKDVWTDTRRPFLNITYDTPDPDVPTIFDEQWNETSINAGTQVTGSTNVTINYAGGATVDTVLFFVQYPNGTTRNFTGVRLT